MTLMVFPGHGYAVAGLVLLGIGTAGGFPVMLGYVGSFITALRGTAFSLVFFIAVTGNILVNYLTGLFARLYGISTFPLVLLVCTGFLTLLLVVVLVRFRDKIETF